MRKTAFERLFKKMLGWLFGDWYFFLRQDDRRFCVSPPIRTIGGGHTPVMRGVDQWTRYLIIKVEGVADSIYVVCRPKVWWWWLFRRRQWVCYQALRPGERVRLGVGREPAEFALAAVGSLPVIGSHGEYTEQVDSDGKVMHLGTDGKPLRWYPRYDLHL